MTISKQDTSSWGRLDIRRRATTRFDPMQPLAGSSTALPFGNGRSYGDSCHNDDGKLVQCRAHNRILDFNRQTGILRAQSGILLSDILQTISNSRWFLPVVPGTQFVTLGGAIANDIHGKNHEHAGTFGRWVTCLSLQRSCGKLLDCSPTTNASMFNATIAGMGLTGIITEAEIQLKNAPSHYVEERRTEFSSINEFISLIEEHQSASDYSVAWIDSLAKGPNLGRGILIEGDHVPCEQVPIYGKPKFSVPFTPPIPLVSGLPLRAFNFAYRKANSRQSRPAIASPNSFFFPLDSLGGWNRLYGPKGLFQHQCVIPLDASNDTIPALIKASQDAGHGSFLTVLKRFGSLRSPGLLSFPREGYTLTLDFPNRGAKTSQLLSLLDAMTIDSGGRTNPYKDARMSAKTFQAGFPDWEKLEALRDPALNSNFWKRTTGRRVIDAPHLQSPHQNIVVNHAAQREVQEAQV